MLPSSKLGLTAWLLHHHYEIGARELGAASEHARYPGWGSGVQELQSLHDGRWGRREGGVF